MRDVPAHASRTARRSPPLHPAPPPQSVNPPPPPPTPCARLSASLMRQAVYGTARLGLHREFSEHMKAAQGGGGWVRVGAGVAGPCVRSTAIPPPPRRNAGDLPAWKSIASSMGSGALASVIGTPFDISLVRMQADSLKPPAGETGGGRLLLRMCWGGCRRTGRCCSVPHRAMCAHRPPLLSTSPHLNPAQSQPPPPPSSHAARQSAAATPTCSTR
jgi:hypothetical protein